MPGSVPLGTVVANALGHFTHRVTIPANTVPGSYTKVASGPSGVNPGTTLTLSDHLTVLNCQVAAAPPKLAFTGFGAYVWLAAALAAVLVGSALVLGARKRRHRHAL